MSAPAKAVRPAKPLAKKPVTAEKSKVLGYVNYDLITVDEDGNETSVLKSFKGFPIFDNRYTTREERGLIAFATENGGTGHHLARLRIQVATEAPKEADISKLVSSPPAPKP
jgi:hypothetical protein